MGEHALLSPSSAKRWIACPGSVAMEAPYPNRTNASAEYGTACHELGQRALEDGIGNCTAYIGTVTGNGHKIDKKMADMIQTYVDSVRGYAAGHTLMVERRVDFSEELGVSDSFGTSDAIIITADGRELSVHDLKTGYHIVDAEDNEQLMLYALGALSEYDLFGDIERVRLVIHQPSQNHLSEWDCSIEYLMEFKERAAKAARIAYVCATKMPENAKDNLYPGKDQCQWCRAFAHCPAANVKVTDIIGAEFDDLTKLEAVSVVPKEPDSLAKKMAATDFIEQWIEAVRAEVERILLAGQAVAGYKLVRGKQGNRAWTSEEEAEALLKSFRCKVQDMYDMKLISPTIAEKRFKKEKPKRWAKIEKLVTRKDGAISVAHVSDEREVIVIQPAIDEFDDISIGDLV